MNARESLGGLIHDTERIMAKNPSFTFGER